MNKTLEELKAEDLRKTNEVAVKPVTDYFKQKALDDHKLLSVVTGENGETVAVAELIKWSPYSGRGKYFFFHFKEHDNVPWRITVDWLDTAVAEPEKYLADRAADDTELAGIIKASDRWGLAAWMDEQTEKPYFDIDNVDFKAAQKALVAQEGVAV